MSFRSGKLQKGPIFYYEQTMDDEGIDEKVAECPNSVSYLGIARPSQRSCGSQQQASNQEDQVAEVGREWTWFTHSGVLV